MKLPIAEWSDLFSEQEVNELYAEAVRRSESMPLPYFDELLRAFELTPLHKVKVVILGQDPYHGFYRKNIPRLRAIKTMPQANGLAFSVDEGCKIPPSLRNIFKELESDLNIKAEHGDLSNWAEQGVLLLNTVLTVEMEKPGSHADIGWEEFTGNIINTLTEFHPPVVFLLMGKKAKESFEKYAAHDNRDNVIYVPHPSPFSARTGFFGSKPFSRVNELLKKLGKMPIDWRV